MKIDFNEHVDTGWPKKLSAEVRRSRALHAAGGSPLLAGHRLLGLANVTKDKTTKRLATIDYKHFFRDQKKKHKK